MWGDKSNSKSVSGWRGPTGDKPPFYKRIWFKALGVLTFIGVITAICAFQFVVEPLRIKSETFDLSKMRELEAASIVYDRHGGEMARIFIENRMLVSISEVPPSLIDALTAQEDSRFFQHDGVDYIGVLRALYLNLKAGEETQGASTITQQLARQSFNLLERTYRRKILEAFLSHRIEQQFSKTEILELYLNKIYFGAGFHGVKAAAKGYFGKEVKNLTIEEAATLCGLIKSPNRLSPIRHPEASIEARNMVLTRMATEGHLSSEEAATLMQKPLVTMARPADPTLTYVFEDVRQEVVKLVGAERAAIGGFQIYTTIDPALQKLAEESTRKRLAEVEAVPDYQHQTYAKFKELVSDFDKKLSAGAINPATPRPKPEYLQASALVIDNKDGSILALVGGRDFVDSQYNRATLSVRPVGTAFLPFVYGAAFSKPGIFPGTQVEDAPIDNKRVMIGGFTGILGEWGTEAQESRWSMANISARESLVNSRNAASVRMGEKVGLAAIKEFSELSGIKSPLKEYPSTYLGASEAKLDEMCMAYSVFPNGGLRPKELFVIRRIADAADKIVFQADEDHALVEAVDPIAAYQTHSCLVEALHRGTGSPAVTQYGLGQFTAGGKTGTHYEFKDLCFFGYTSTVTCGVRVGFDSQKQVYLGAFSNKTALPIWTDIINASAQSYPPTEILPPDNAEKVELCRKSGMRATDFCYEKIKDANGEVKSVRHTYEEYLRPGTVFDSYCIIHTSDGATAPDARALQGLASIDAATGTMGPDLARFSHIDPVPMQGLTILGADPYQSLQPVLRARPVVPDGTVVKRPEIVDPDPLDGFEPVLKLAPPQPLKIE